MWITVIRLTFLGGSAAKRLMKKETIQALEMCSERMHLKEFAGTTPFR